MELGHCLLSPPGAQRFFIGRACPPIGELATRQGAIVRNEPIAFRLMGWQAALAELTPVPAREARVRLISWARIAQGRGRDLSPGAALPGGTLDLRRGVRVAGLPSYKLTERFTEAAVVGTTPIPLLRPKGVH